MEYDRDTEYIVELDSDDDSPAVSSDDEIDVILNGTPKQKRHLRRRSLGKVSSSSEDDFEKEMNAELDVAVKDLQKKTDFTGPSVSEAAGTEEKFYDNDYFDSDSDEEGTSAEKKQKKHPVLSNDDLLYDPNMDDEDQRWVDARRQRYLPKGGGGLQTPKGKKKERQGTNQVQPLPKSDAVLNCPCCMTTLCMDCQRHDLYKNQYRAMFVMNCKVDNDERLRYPKPGIKSNRKRKHAKQSDSSKDQSDVPGESQDQADMYHPVHCKECNTEVGVFDEEEIFHFHNVLASYA